MNPVNLGPIINADPTLNGTSTKELAVTIREEQQQILK